MTTVTRGRSQVRVRRGRRRAPLLFAAPLLLLLGACPEKPFDYGRPCEVDRDCPEGYRCARVLDESATNGVCVKLLGDAGSGTTDAAVDAALADGAGHDQAHVDSSGHDQATVDAGGRDLISTDHAGSDGGQPNLGGRGRLDQSHRLSPAAGVLQNGTVKLRGRVVTGSDAELHNGTTTLNGRISVLAR
jgi:hypothetical protein